VLCSVVLYTSEALSMAQVDRKRLEVMEKWIWRTLENISWVDKILNEEVYKE